MGDLDGYFEPIDQEMARVERIIAALEAKNAELESALAKSASREAALVEKLRVAEEALTFFKFRGATPEQKAYAMEALAKIKEES